MNGPACFRTPLGTAVCGLGGCLLLGIVLLVSVEIYRQKVSRDWRDASILNQVHLELVETLRLDMAVARYTSHAIVRAGDEGSLSRLEARLDASLIRARDNLVLLHQGGRYEAGDGVAAIALPAPLPSPRLEQASLLVPLIQGLHDQAALLLGAMISQLRPGQDRFGDRDPQQALGRMDVLFDQAESVAAQVARDLRLQIMDHHRTHDFALWWVPVLAGLLGAMLLAAMFALGFFALRKAARLAEEREREQVFAAEVAAGMDRLLEAMPVGIALLDHQRIVRRVNLAATNLLDIEPSWSREERISWDMFCPQAKSPDMLPYPRARFELETTMHTLDDRVLDVLKSSIPLVLHSESLTLEVFLDITRRKRAEQALLREKNRLEALLAGIDEGVALTDRDGVVLEVNANLTRILGRSQAELVGTLVQDLFSDNLLSVELGAGLDQLRRDPQVRIREIQLEAFRDLALVVRLQAMVDGGQFEGMIVSVIEVTQIVEAKRRAEAASQAKSMFLANMSHEIRTPLNSIVGHGELLAGMTLTAQQSECVQGIRVCADSLLLIINDILDFSKIEAGMMRIVVEPVDLEDLLSRIETMFGDQARSKGLALRLVTHGLPQMVQTDSGRLGQVLINLVGNAVKFTHQGHVEVMVQAEQSSPGRYAVRFDVHDTGIGISPDRQVSIFDSFEQADGSLTRQYGGTGLGLTIADSLVRLLGGSGVEVRSAQGVGSTFSFALTLDVAPGRGQPPRRQDSRTGDVRSFAHVRVLAVEDNAFNRTLLAKMLEVLGVREVTMVENGQEAVDLLQVNGDFDLVLMDIQMPVLDGLEATRRIRALGLTLPIVALTAHALEADQHKSFEAGMNGHLSKPYRPQELAQTLTKWCC